MRPAGSTPSIALGIYLFYLLYFALAPFTFRWEAGLSLDDLLAQRFEGMASVWSVTAWDVWTNILLFLPFGLLLAWLPFITALRSPSIMLVSGMTAALLSAGIELAQALLPRHPSLVDIACNVLGAVLGSALGIVLHRLGHGRDARPRWRLAAKWGGAAVAAYWAVLCMVFSVPLPLAPDFSNWDPDLSLNLGNETALSRPWRGVFHGVALYDRALSQEQVLAKFSAGPSGMGRSSGSPGIVARYDFSEGVGTTIFDRAGSGTPVDLHIEDPSLVRWLAPSGLAIIGSTGMSSSMGSGKPAHQRLSASGEMSVESWVTLANSNEPGPNPFVASSNRVDLRNFALAQDAGDLVFWLRTPLTGLNGRKKELRTGNEPVTPGLQHVVVTYASSIAALYLNGVQEARLLLAQKQALLDWLIDELGPYYEPALRSAFLFPLGMLSCLSLRSVKPFWLPFAAALAAAGIIEAARALLLKSPSATPTIVISAATVLAGGITAARLTAHDSPTPSVSK